MVVVMEMWVGVVVAVVFVIGVNVVVAMVD